MRPRASRGWERLFWTVFERSTNAMALVTDQRRVAEVNPALQKLLGYQRDDLVGRPTWDFLHPSMQPLAEAAWQRFLEDGTTSGHRDLLRATGERVRIEYAAHTELVTGRRLVLVVAVHVEIDDLPESATAAGKGEQALSPREREVVELIAMGRSGVEIAEELHVAPETVRSHVLNARAKAGANNRAHLVAIALGQGLIAAPDAE